MCQIILFLILAFAISTVICGEVVYQLKVKDFKQKRSPAALNYFISRSDYYGSAATILLVIYIVICTLLFSVW